jgi:hypothetical protein
MRIDAGVSRWFAVARDREGRATAVGRVVVESGE